MINILNKTNLDGAHDIAKNKYTNQFNCWGATLYVLDKIEYLEWVNNQDMTQFLDNETYIVKDCSIVKGDIYVMYNNYEGLIHTAVYVGNNLLWHKMGGEESQFTTEEEIKNIYWNYDKIEIRRINPK